MSWTEDAHPQAAWWCKDGPGRHRGSVGRRTLQPRLEPRHGSFAWISAPAHVLFVVVPSGPPPSIPVHDIDIFHPRSRAVERANPSRDPEGSRESFGRQPKRPFLHHVALRARRFVHVRTSWRHLPRRTSERRSAWCRRARSDTKERCISWTQRTPSWRSRMVSLAHALSRSESRHETLQRSK